MLYSAASQYGKKERVMSIPQDSEENLERELLDRIKLGVEAEQQATIEELIKKAEQSNDPNDWNLAAIGFHQANRFDEAIDILTQLVDKFPANDIYRLNLATAYSQIESIDLCRFHLKYLAERGSTDEMRRIAKEQLSGYESFLGLGESDAKLRDLQIRFLEEAITRDSRAPENYIRLARLFIRISKLEPGGGGFTRATKVLEAGLNAIPNHREILELLLYCYLHTDLDQKMNATVSQLEQVAPGSSVLELLGDIYTNRGRGLSENLSWRAQSLMQQVGQSNEGWGNAALRDLTRIVDTYPDNPFYRLNYAFALITVGRTQESLLQAVMLDQVSSEEHGFHFNLGQIFWLSGEPVRGRRHLDLAIQYATTEQEEKDARERIAELEITD